MSARVWDERAWREWRAGILTMTPMELDEYLEGQTVKITAKLPHDERIAELVEHFKPRDLKMLERRIAAWLNEEPDE